MDSILSKIDKSRLPRHVAIIMDGNGRWAREHGWERSLGHRNGVTTVREITEAAVEVGLEYLTLYTFSTENWNRPADEVDMLMHLVVSSIERETPDLIKNNVRLTAIGDLARLPQFASERLQRCFDDTAHCTGLVLCLALSYSSRWELTRACRLIAQDVQAGKLDVEHITEDTVSARLATAGMPDPDLMIRTGGDVRVSNYLLWQIAYSELVFNPKYWPDFTREDLYAAIVDYQSRQRRYGKTGDQIEAENTNAR